MSATRLRPCWICRRRLTVDTDGDGHQVEYCERCWREIQTLRARLKVLTDIRQTAAFVSPGGRKTKYDWELGRELWCGEIRVAEIAAVLGCRRPHVYRAAERFDWPRPRPKQQKRRP